MHTEADHASGCLHWREGLALRGVDGVGESGDGSALTGGIDKSSGIWHGR